MRQNKYKFILLFFYALILSSFYFDNNLTFAQEQQETHVLDAVKWQQGPSVANMSDIAEIRIPEGCVFADGSDTRLLMESMGNIPSNAEVGFFAPNTLEWFVVFDFSAVGYIKDDEKDSLDADAMLESIKNASVKSNEIRRERGFPGLHIIGWEVAPQYNAKTNNLEWAIRAKDDEGLLVLNHNTRLLGRKGVMKATLVVDPQILSTVLPAYRDHLKEFSFKSGQKYAEYSQGDKIAKYGLSALVAGGAGAAAAKFGLFKLLGKNIKIVIFALIAFLAGIWKAIKRFFKAGRKEDNLLVGGEQ
jgi:uncharacterized membrane-anchored protein